MNLNHLKYKNILCLSFRSRIKVKYKRLNEWTSNKRNNDIEQKGEKKKKRRGGVVVELPLSFEGFF